MTEYYMDYVWKNGFPYGIRKCGISDAENTYKLVSDPYNKRVSIENYTGGSFCRIIYDSALFDFRHLKQGERLAWQKTKIKETETTALCHIRNQDDRLVLIEEYLFEDGLCRECKAFSPIGFPISVQKISYKILNDDFDGVVLYDINDHIVVSKRYKFDEEAREFTELVKEEWEGRTI